MGNTDLADAQLEILRLQQLLIKEQNRADKMQCRVYYQHPLDDFDPGVTYKDIATDLSNQLKELRTKLESVEIDNTWLKGVITMCEEEIKVLTEHKKNALHDKIQLETAEARINQLTKSLDTVVERYKNGPSSSKSYLAYQMYRDAGGGTFHE